MNQERSDKWLKKNGETIKSLQKKVGKKSAAPTQAPQGGKEAQATNTRYDKKFNNEIKILKKGNLRNEKLNKSNFKNQ
jgi:hypothetical protein